MKILSITPVFVVLLLSAPAWGSAKPIPSPPSLKASSYLLMDFDSGRVLAEKNADERLPPASLTKMMTAYLVDKAIADGDISLDDIVTVSKKAWQMKGSLMFIEVGEKVSVEDLLKGLIIQSGNDASVALAEHIAGSESAFVGYMNHQAQLLGMSNTNFMNATGIFRNPIACTKRRPLSTTIFPNPIGISCCAATNRSTESKPVTPRQQAIAWLHPPGAGRCV